MKTVIIIQARMSSTRLPGKVLKEILGRPLLNYQIERLNRVRGVDQIIIATTDQPEDDAIVEFCKKNAVPHFRGSEKDVLDRYFQCASHYKAQIIVRITADCPLIDPEITTAVIEKFKNNSHSYDYLTNALPRTFPRGLDTEVFSMVALSQAHRDAKDPTDREHVTAYIYNNPHLFKIGSYVHFSDLSKNRWTVDTPEDFALISKILETTYPENPKFNMEDVLLLLNKNPSWSLLNAHIEQKKNQTKTTVIRVDASLKIGTGHVVRCLALGTRFRQSGWNVLFFCREVEGNLFDLIEKQGFKVFKLSKDISSESEDGAAVLAGIKSLGFPVQMIWVDHYELSAVWEKYVRKQVQKICVIDDLANRPHDCDLILDQNFNLNLENRYSSLIPKNSKKLLGPQYALLRSEFKLARESLKPRDRQLKRIMIFFGGVDITNETSKTIRAMTQLNRNDLQFDIVIGSTNPHQTVIKKSLCSLKNVHLHIQSKEISRLMAENDLFIGAGGTSLWERFSLGLPSISICTADNQLETLSVLSKEGYTAYLGKAANVDEKHILMETQNFLDHPEKSQKMSELCFALLDAKGTDRVYEEIREY